MTYSVYHSFRIITPRGGCPKSIGPLIIPRKSVAEKSYPYQQFSFRQIPRMIAPWMIAHKESCSRGNLSHPRNIASEENCFPPVQLLPKKITLEKNSRTIATMDACSPTILQENSLEGNFPHPIQSSKIIPSNEYYELTEVHYLCIATSTKVSK